MSVNVLHYFIQTSEPISSASSASSSSEPNSASSSSSEPNSASSREPNSASSREPNSASTTRTSQSGSSDYYEIKRLVEIAKKKWGMDAYHARKFVMDKRKKKRTFNKRIDHIYRELALLEDEKEDEDDGDTM
jgi:glucan-binding YG repeat protein